MPCPGDSSCKPVSISPTPNTDHERKRKLMGTMFGNLDQVPFDPAIDPEPHACFACWSFLHITRHCQDSTLGVYCRNCGRRNVEVDECPRCARAYRETKECREEESISRMKVKLEWSDYKDSQNEAELNELFTIMRRQKMQDQVELDRAFDGESDYSDYYFYDDEEDENYDDYVVDEDEKSKSLCNEDYAVRFFVDLLGALKHLAIDVQNTAVLNFVSARRKQISQIQMAEKIS